jgi:CDP-diacylglycerol--glycerol-3-phosphate 3-phosphatidyltransferase
MTIYALKPRFQALLRPLCGRIVEAGMTANQVTLLAMLLSLVVGGLLYALPAAVWPLYLVPLALLVRMALNAMDGMLAREHSMTSPLGTILNELGDVVSDAALYLPFAVVPGVPGLPVVLVVLLGVLSELAGVVAVQIGAGRRYEGPMGKSDRAFVFGALAVLLALGVPRGPWIGLLLWVVSGMLLLTIWNRARRALAEVSPR